MTDERGNEIYEVFSAETCFGLRYDFEEFLDGLNANKNKIAEMSSRTGISKEEIAEFNDWRLKHILGF